MSGENEVWQVEIDGKVYETDLDGLKRWVGEGRVLPSDRVKKGDLNWIAAQRVPSLRGSFAVVSTPPPVDNPVSGIPPREEFAPVSVIPPQEPPILVASDLPLPPAKASDSCRNHPDSEARYICRVCGSQFCPQCPQYVGSSRIPTCPACGDLCVSIEKQAIQQAKLVQQEELKKTVGAHFGGGALSRALQYPLLFPGALLGASLVYGFLLLGSFVGFRSGLLAVMLANGLLFGCLAQVVKQVAWGRFKVNFLGGFDTFSLWENAIYPTIMGFCIMVVTVGPLLLLFIAMLTGWVGNPADLPSTYQHEKQELEKQAITGEEMEALLNSEGGENEKKALEKLDKMRPASQAQQMVEDETPKSDTLILFSLAKGYYSHAPQWILALIFLFLLWGIWYYPMALAVAGYSEDLGSILNPLVGLDTVKRMGGVYWKVFGMYLVVQGIGFLLSFLVNLLTASLTLPLMGNIPARLLDGVITFYASLAVAYLLGLALNHCAPQLNIPAD
jgi:hypothetical protein